MRIRLDKLLADAGIGSRSQARQLIREGRVTVDGDCVRSPDAKVDAEKSQIVADGSIVTYQKYIYLMLNKPAGVITARKDGHGERTAFDLLEERYRSQRLGLFPVGRLDKDTTGLLLFTNDGRFGHSTLSPSHHVSKRYHVVVDGELDANDVRKFGEGVVLRDGYTCKSAVLTILESAEGRAWATLEITEGKFHQVKRMFEAEGKRVLQLKRIAFAGIELDDRLPEGKARELTSAEMQTIMEYVSE